MTFRGQTQPVKLLLQLFLRQCVDIPSTAYAVRPPRTLFDHRAIAPRPPSMFFCVLDAPPSLLMSALGPLCALAVILGVRALRSLSRRIALLSVISRPRSLSCSINSSVKLFKLSAMYSRCTHVCLTSFLAVFSKHSFDYKNVQTASSAYC